MTAPILSGVLVYYSQNMLAVFIALLFSVFGFLVVGLAVSHNEEIKENNVNILKDYRNALIDIKTSGALFYWILMSFLIFFFLVQNATIYGFLTQEPFGFNSIKIAIVEFCFAIGSLIAAYMTKSKYSTSVKNVYFLGITLVLYGIASICFAFNESMILTFIIYFLLGFLFIQWLIYQSIAEEKTKDKFLAKSSSLSEMFSFGLAFLYLRAFNFFHLDLYLSYIFIGIFCFLLSLSLFIWKKI